MSKTQVSSSPKAVVSVQGPLSKAVVMAMSGRLDVAEQICRRSGLDVKSQAESLICVAKACIQSGQEASGVYLLQRSVHLDVACSDANYLLADVFLGRRDFAQALVYLRNLDRTHPDSADLQIAIAQTCGALGLLSDATDSFSKAIKITPLPLEMLWEAARQAMAADRFEEAVEALQAAHLQSPEHVATLNDLGVALLRLNRSDEARECFQKILAVAPAEIPARLNLVAILKESRQFEDALEHLYEVRNQMPHSASVLGSLCQTLGLLGRYSEALECGQRGLRLAPDSAELHHFVGAALRGLRRHDEALVHLQLAQRQQPNNGHLLLEMGEAELETGDLESAEASLARLLRVEPRWAPAHRSYSRVHRYHPGDPHTREMERLLADDSIAENDRIDLHFALGKAMDDAACYREAFEHFAAGNAMKRRQIEFDEAASRQLFETMTNMPLQPGGPQSSTRSDRPIFVIGMPRSGSSLVEQILASHPAISGLGERSDWQRCLDGDKASFLQVLNGATESWLTRLGTAYLESTASDAGTALRTVDKMPSNFMYAGIIHLALPGAKIIHVTRNPIDTCFSCYSQLFSSPQSFAYDLSELGRFYRRYSELMAHWESFIPGDALMRVQYEDLVDEPENVIRDLIAFCGMRWDSRCLASHESKSPVTTASLAQVRSPIYRTKISHSERYSEFLGPLKQALGAEILRPN